MKTKTKATRMIYLELKWMHEHPEYSLPQWYIRLVFDAEYRLNLGDPDGALHDIQQACKGRLNSIYGCMAGGIIYRDKDIIYTDTDSIYIDTDSSYPLQEGAENGQSV